MFRHFSACLAAASAFTLALAPGVQAQSPAQAGGAESKAASAEHLDGKKRVCKAVTYTGSRLGATKICKSRAEWEELAETHRKVLERQQMNRDFKFDGG